MLHFAPGRPVAIQGIYAVYTIYTSSDGSCTHAGAVHLFCIHSVPSVCDLCVFRMKQGITKMAVFVLLAFPKGDMGPDRGTAIH